MCGRRVDVGKVVLTPDRAPGSNPDTSPRLFVSAAANMQFRGSLRVMQFGFSLSTGRKPAAAKSGHPGVTVAGAEGFARVQIGHSCGHAPHRSKQTYKQPTL